MGELKSEFEYVEDRWNDIRQKIEGDEVYTGTPDVPYEDIDPGMHNDMEFMKLYLADLKKAVEHAEEEIEELEAPREDMMKVAPALRALADRLMSPMGQALAVRQARALAEEYDENYPPPKPPLHAWVKGAGDHS